MAERTLRWTRTVVIEGPASWVLGTRERSATMHLITQRTGITQADERLEQVGANGWEPVAAPPVRVPAVPNLSIPELPLPEQR